MTGELTDACYLPPRSQGSSSSSSLTHSRPPYLKLIGLAAVSDGASSIRLRSLSDSLLVADGTIAIGNQAPDSKTGTGSGADTGTGAHAHYGEDGVSPLLSLLPGTAGGATPALFTPHGR